MQGNILDNAVAGSTRQSLDRQLGLRRGDALIVVDMQRDFMPGGSLAVPRADEIVERINEYVAVFEARDLPIFFTRDWHPPDHCSFEQSGGEWPPHCVQGTRGAEWADGLRIPDTARVVSKATDKDTEAYSGFAGTSLLTSLTVEQVRRLFIAGVATDYCVRATVMSALAHGFEVVVLADAVRGVNREPGDEARAMRTMLDSGASLFRNNPAFDRTTMPFLRR
jgi:nicotinamidase/pyrazinamidase